MTSLALQGLLGFTCFLGLAWGLSENRKKIDLRVVVGGILLQATLAFLILKVSVIRAGFEKISYAISQLKEATLYGTRFVFGYLGGGSLPFSLAEGKGPGDAFIFAFQPLPMIMVVSALAMLLFHWGVLQSVVKGFSWALRKTLNIGGLWGFAVLQKSFWGKPMLRFSFVRIWRNFHAMNFSPS